MPDLLQEELLPFALAIRSLPGTPHVSTGYRYAMQGIRGVVLETVKVGGKRFTSRQAIMRFIAALTRVTTPSQNARSSKAPASQLQVNKRLNSLGR